MKRKQETGRKKKGTWIIVVAVILVMAAMSNIAKCSSSKTDEKTEKIEKTETTVKKDETDRTAEKFGVDRQFIEKLYSACDGVGVTSENIVITELTAADTETFKFEYEGYVFTGQGTANGDVTSLESGGIYFIDNGEPELQVHDVLVTTEEKSALMIYTEDAVKKMLKAPSTAKFPGHVLERSEWKVTKNKDTYNVSSYVDAENSFGAKIRTNFFVSFQWDGSDETTPTLLDAQLIE